MVGDIFDVHEGTCDVSIVGLMNGGQPCGFYGETSGSVEIVTCRVYSGEFVHIVYELLRVWVFYL